MKKYSRRSRNILIVSCVLGLLYAGYLTDNTRGGISSATLIALGVLIVTVTVILLVIKRFV